MPAFWVADLTPAGELRLEQEYEYRHLEGVGGAIELIATFANHFWRTPAGFDVRLPGTQLSARWAACSATSGIATLRDHAARGDAGEPRLVSLVVLVCGRAPDDDAATVGPVQRHLLRGLHDTGTEPAFDLLRLGRRPLAASLHFALPAAPADRPAFALADRCLAAAYFRTQGLA